MRFGTITCLASVLLSACAAGPRPDNAPGGAWMPEQMLVSAVDQCTSQPTFLPALPALDRVDSPVALRLASGDRVRLRIIGDDDRISGTYVLGDGGALNLPGVGRVDAQGLSLAQLEVQLRALLVQQNIVQPLRNAVQLQLVESAGVSVAVSGAVFQPGTVRAGERQRDARVGQSEGLASGDANVGRSVATALRAAGGVRPDADIRRIGLIRGGRLAVLNLQAGHDGAAPGDVLLTAGDRLIVPSTGCFDADLVRPSLVTTPGIRVFMSNLARSANNNAGAAIGNETTSLPYGTRLTQGMFALNCVGGSAMNAKRKVILISRNPMTGQSVVVERKVEELVRNADRDDYDPYLMPGDALACYDSRWMNFRDAMGLVTDAVSSVTPVILLEEALSN